MTIWSCIKDRRRQGLGIEDVNHDRAHAELTKEFAIVPRTRRPPDRMAMIQEKGREPATNDARCARKKDPAHGTRYVLRSGPQILVEPIERSLPSLFRRHLVVARRRVVVEAVVGALIDVSFVGNAGSAKRCVE